MLRQKWSMLVAKGHSLKVEFNVLQDPLNTSRALAIDVAQNIDGEWHVQTIQHKAYEAYSTLGIHECNLDRLINILGAKIHSVIDRETDVELHLIMKRISPESGEIYGYITSNTGQKTGIRPNYQHYYVLNEILEQTARLRKEKYTEVHVHRSKDNFGRIYFRFVGAN
jgi:hypothetical protein